MNNWSMSSEVANTLWVNELWSMSSEVANARSMSSEVANTLSMSSEVANAWSMSSELANAAGECGDGCHPGRQEKIQWNLRPAMFILYKEGKESRLPDGPARAALCIERRALF